LKLALEHARKSGAAHKALITFTFNRVSQGLYNPARPLPKMPIYFFDAARERVMAGLPEPLLRSIVIEDTVAHMKSLAEIDARAVGATRAKHHRYLLNDPGTTGVMLCAGSECVGYTYVGSNGHIGPLAVTQANFLGDAFTTALKMAAARSSEKISAFVPGTCDSALSLAVNHGMRITFPMLLMASPGYGQLDAISAAQSGFYVNHSVSGPAVCRAAMRPLAGATRHSAANARNAALDPMRVWGDGLASSCAPALQYCGLGRRKLDAKSNKETDQERSATLKL